MSKLKLRILRFIANVTPNPVLKWLLFSTVTGVIVGLAAVLFVFILSTSSDFLLNKIGHLNQPYPSGESGSTSSGTKMIWWYLALLPAVGGLITGLLIWKFSPDAEGEGTDAYIDAYHRNKGVIKPRTTLVAALGSIMTLCTGGSAGREGPLTHIGAGLGSLIGQYFSLSPKDKRLLMMAGAAAGIGAIFRSPIGGAFFVTEVLYRDPEIEHPGIIPCLISSIMGFCTFSIFFNSKPIFTVPEVYGLHAFRIYELPLFAILGAICAIAGLAFIWMYNFILTHRIRTDKYPFINPMLGGLFVGIIGIFLPQTLGSGYGYIQQVLYERAEIWVVLLLLGLAVAKMATTSLTLGSGGNGGLFAPVLFMGAMAGGAFGKTANSMFGGSIDPTGYTVVGMASFFAAVGNAPITAVILTAEVAGSYGLLLPLMIGCIASYLLAGDKSAYMRQVTSRAHSPAHQGDFDINVLEGIKVRDSWQSPPAPILINENAGYTDIVRLANESNAKYIAIAGEDGMLSGIISTESIKLEKRDSAALEFLIAADIAEQDFAAITPDEDLYSVLTKFTQTNADELPVVESVNIPRIKGFFPRKDLVNGYSLASQKRNADADE